MKVIIITLRLKMAQQVTLEELKSLQVALDQTYEGLRSITMLGESQGIFRTAAFLNLMNNRFTKVVESVNLSRKMVKVEIENYEKTKNMNDREKVVFYALSALEDMQMAYRQSATTKQ